MNNRIDYKNLHYFDTKGPEQAYWVGFLAADGYTNGQSGKIVIGLSASDIIQLQRFADIFGVPIHHYYSHCKAANKYYASINIQICNKTIYKSLADTWGFADGKMARLNSSLFDTIPDDLKPDFLRGYFDGDGTARHYAGIATCSPKFLETIERYITKMCGDIEAKHYIEGGTYKMAIGKHKNIAKFYDLIYTGAKPGTYIARKQIALDNTLMRYRSKIA